MGPTQDPKLVFALWHDLRSFLFRRLARASDAEDIAQDTMVEVLERPPRDTSQISGWMKVVARRQAARVVRRERARQARERLVARPDVDWSTADGGDPRAQLVALYVNELKEPYRTVVRMHFLEERELHDIAEILRRPPATVRSQLKRGLDQLRTRLAPEEAPRRSRIAGLLAAWFSRLRARPAESSALALVVVTGIVAIPFLRAPLRGEEASVAVASAASPDATPSGPPSRAPEEARVRLALDAPLADGPPAPAPASWTLDLTGSVVADDGPVPGAAVLVGTMDGSSSRIVATTDARGEYRAAGVGALEWLWVEAEGRLPSVRHLVGSTRAGVLDIRLAKDRGLLSGRVLSHDGTPVAGALVSHRYNRVHSETPTIGDRTSTLVLNPPRLSATTDSDGRFRMLRDPPLERSGTKWGYLWIRAAGEPPAFLPIPAAESDRDVEFRLPPPCRLVARILAEDGAPLAGAPLELLLHEPFEPREATTGEDGVITLDALPRGPFALRLLRHPAGALESCFVEGEFEDPSSAREIRLGTDTTLRGRVEEHGRPLAGGGIRLRQVSPDHFAVGDRLAVSGED